MIELHKIFDIKYGNQFDLNKMEIVDDGINFISRSSRHNGLSAKVKKINGVKPNDAGSITVTMGGTYLLSAFVQPKPFYTGQNIKVLTPYTKMTLKQKFFYCTAIQKNRFRYTSHGREANSTFDNILVPSIEDIPEWVDVAVIPSFDDARKCLLKVNTPSLNVDDWRWFRYSDLFDIKKGKRLTKNNMFEGETPFIGAIEYNNGYRDFIGQPPIHSGNTITVNYNGSIAEAFYQPHSFWASDDVNVLYPKFSMNPYIALFLTALIRAEKYRFNYGRKWHKARMENSMIKLPITDNGTPNWDYMEEYIKSLPYSKNIDDESID